MLRFTPAVPAQRGESVALSLVVCADPRPRHVSWEWGSLRIEAGDRIGRLIFENFILTSRYNCFVTFRSLSGGRYRSGS